METPRLQHLNGIGGQVIEIDLEHHDSRTVEGGLDHFRQGVGLLLEGVNRTQQINGSAVLLSLPHEDRTLILGRRDR